jgi:hypothetical protein
VTRALGGNGCWGDRVSQGFFDGEADWGDALDDGSWKARRCGLRMTEPFSDMGGTAYRAGPSLAANLAAVHSLASGDGDAGWHSRFESFAEQPASHREAPRQLPQNWLPGLHPRRRATRNQWRATLRQWT